MPIFTKWRAALGESRALIEARGHLVEPGEEEDGLSVLVMGVPVSLGLLDIHGNWIRRNDFS
jgi:hypothetical protein